MISYELAKQLKEAGFPQKRDPKKGELFSYLAYYKDDFNIEVGTYDTCCASSSFNYDEYVNAVDFKECEESSIGASGWVCYIPTLEELIEACGDEKFSLWCYPHGYIIGFTPGSMKDDMRICKTPSEAVARLWLALNKK